MNSLSLFHPHCHSGRLPLVAQAVIAGLLLTSASAPAEETTATRTPATAVERLSLHPTEVHLVGRDSRQQLLVTGSLPGERLIDLTRDAVYETSDPGIATVDEQGVVHPAGSGTAVISVRAGGAEARVPVRIEHGETFLPVDFLNEIAPIFSRRGCNGGGCHGKSTGRGGFRLSLFGFHPDDDYEFITRESRGRRVFPGSPVQSLLLRKPAMQVPHGGGRKLEPGEPEYERLVRWIGSNMPRSAPGSPRLVSLELDPAERVLDSGNQQQMQATAIYSDGSRRDITRLVEFRTNNPSIAEVDQHGLVSTGTRTGEAAIVAQLGSQIAVSRVVVPLRERQTEFVEFPVRNFIDEHILRKLRVLNVPPAPLASDAKFLRRASLQIAGRLPTVEETEQFLADTTPDRREVLIRRLVNSPEYADFFAQKWGDLLRNKRRGQRPRIPETIAFHRWIRDALARDMPYDEFVTRILTATGPALVNPPAQWYAEVRYLDRYVDDTAQVFLGVRIGCARCHDHPFENYSQNDYHGLAAFFARVDRKGGSGVAERRAGETVVVKPTGTVKHPVTGEVVLPQGLGGPPLEIPAWEDPRRHLADWMTSPENPMFARALVNRMWAHFFGRGLVDPLDDMRTTNPAANEPLLDELSQWFISNGYRIRPLVELICSSSAWQLDSAASVDNLHELQNHSRFYVRRLQAELLLDAIDTATGSPTGYSGLPKQTRAIALPDEDYSNQFLTLFGRPKRESACECERDPAASLSQSLYVMNDAFVLQKVSRGQLMKELVAPVPQTKQADSTPGAADDVAPADIRRQRIRRLFLATLTREPSAGEYAEATAWLDSQENLNQAWQDLLWALLNTKEFMYLH
ncbi:MAG: DUF1549 domain-containing protein [Planctomycetaceae bacterium]|nr:DUF1549 domain-containing protein [Planctomycetaceae bacterium]